jgi:hypothetical protein
MFSNALHGENSRNGSLCTIAPCLDLALRSAVLGIVHDRDKLDWADFALLICTETYYRRFRGHEQSDKGKEWIGKANSSHSTGNLYYLVLLPMGLGAAGFLFFVIRSGCWEAFKRPWGAGDNPIGQHLPCQIDNINQRPLI